MESGSLVTSPLVVLPVHLRCFLSTRSIMPVHVLRMTPSPRVVPVSLMVCLMSTRRLWPRMALPVSIVVSFLQSLASLCTVVSTSVSMTRLVRFVCHFYSIPETDLEYRTCCSCWCTRGLIPCILLAWLVCYYRCWHCLIPSGHYSSSYDDDLWFYHALQVNVRCRFASMSSYPFYCTWLNLSP